MSYLFMKGTAYPFSFDMHAFPFDVTTLVSLNSCNFYPFLRKNYAKERNTNVCNKTRLLVVNATRNVET